MKGTWKKVANIFSVLLMVILLSFMLLHRFQPQVLSDVMPYQLYNIPTGSMEPVIPTWSMAVVKPLRNEEPKVGDIVTFHANHFGTPIILTHYLKKVEVQEDGRKRYYTQAAIGDTYDSYTTYREDLIGTCVFHIPFLGKILLFLQSFHALIMFLLIGLSLLVNRLISVHFEEKGIRLDDTIRFGKRGKAQEYITFERLYLFHEAPFTVLRGTVCNTTKNTLCFMRVLITFYDENHEVVGYRKYYVSDKFGLKPMHESDFECMVDMREDITHFDINIISCKKR